ncbi:MAG: 30S ribosomal protein S6 [Candidatus Shikimatogenerans sp. Ttur]|uniref:Small ribosomal subunit protein bS6 n=1 Tax=Candidatus Shikimatogenerans sp. Ttur TaxID=3158569 RepID=A0AAU7ZY07_9FLAO
MQKLYEIVFIINSFLKEKKIFLIIKNYKKYINKKKGNIIYEENWGIKNLKYKIKKNDIGYYYLLIYKISSKYIKKIIKKIKNDKNIIRYLIIKLDKHHINYIQKKYKIINNELL